MTDVLDPHFRRPTFVPRHFHLEHEQFCLIASRLLDDRFLILGTMFERFEDKEWEVMYGSGNGDQSADALCKMIYRVCMESISQLMDIADTLAFWLNYIKRRRSNNVPIRLKKKLRLQTFLESFDTILRTLDQRLRGFPEIPTPADQKDYAEKRREYELTKAKNRMDE
ncbi:hypothetical protein PFISCL1PPCAC_28229 [Pristionchus fissidentatus]|uniref:Uncharacterized protein n=1 Tax=Pristionchus fissidentatus TaxID=1538716 RepID=A0AAV5X0S6_9BILA|nr:hypothetical protein PFISCL1PPCAC_28229 [Pristionchus fissidentatus]